MAEPLLDWPGIAKKLRDEAPSSMLFSQTVLANRPEAAAVCALAAFFLEADGFAFVSHAQLAQDLLAAAESSLCSVKIAVNPYVMTKVIKFVLPHICGAQEVREQVGGAKVRGFKGTFQC